MYYASLSLAIMLITYLSIIICVMSHIFGISSYRIIKMMKNEEGAHNSIAGPDAPHDTTVDVTIGGQ